MRYAAVIFGIFVYFQLLVSYSVFIDPMLDILIWMLIIFPVFSCLFYYLVKDAKLIITDQKGYSNKRLLSVWREFKPFRWDGNLSIYRIIDFQKHNKSKLDKRFIKSFQKHEKGILVVNTDTEKVLNYISNLYWEIGDSNSLEEFIEENTHHDIQQLDNNTIVKRYYPEMAINNRFVWACIGAFFVYLAAMVLLFIDDYRTLDFGFMVWLLVPLIILTGWIGYRWMKKDNESHIGHQIFFSLLVSFGVAFLVSQAVQWVTAHSQPARNDATFKLAEIHKNKAKEVWMNDAGQRVYCEKSDKPLNETVVIETKRLFSLVRINPNDLCKSNLSR